MLPRITRDYKRNPESCGESEVIFKTLRKVYKLFNSSQNYFEACRIVYKLWGVRKIFTRLWKVYKLCNCSQNHFEACTIFYKLWGVRKKYLGHLGRSTSFVTVVKIILKLVQFFTSCGELEKNI